MFFYFNLPVFAEKVAEFEVRRIAVDEWPPYQSLTSKYYGGVNRIIMEAFGVEGVKVEYGWFPWKRSLLYAQNGKWDGAAELNRYAEKSNPVRKQSIQLIPPIIFLFTQSHSLHLCA